MCGPEDPLFTPLLPLARVPFQARQSVHKTPFWENFEILASTASIFAQILALKPSNLEISSSQAPKFGHFQLTSPQIWKFSAHKPPLFRGKCQFASPTLRKSGPHTPTWKKVEYPPPPPPGTKSLGQIHTQQHWQGWKHVYFQGSWPFFPTIHYVFFFFFTKRQNFHPQIPKFPFKLQHFPVRSFPDSPFFPTINTGFYAQSYMHSMRHTPKWTNQEKDLGHTPLISISNNNNHQQKLLYHILLTPALPNPRFRRPNGLLFIIFTTACINFQSHWNQWLRQKLGYFV